MFIVVKLGGCSGSGKSSIIHALFKQFTFEPLEVQPGRAARPLAYRAPPLYVLGPYTAQCGGMDAVSGTSDDRAALVDRYAKPGRIVILEGLLVGKAYGAMGHLADSKRHAGKWIYGFMDTPFDVCIARINQRRAAKGVGPLENTANITIDYKAAQSMERRMREAGQHVVSLNHTRSPDALAQQLLKIAREKYDAG